MQKKKNATAALEIRIELLSPRKVAMIEPFCSTMSVPVQVKAIRGLIYRRRRSTLHVLGDLIDNFSSRYLFSGGI